MWAKNRVGQRKKTSNEQKNKEYSFTSIKFDKDCTVGKIQLTRYKSVCNFISLKEWKLLALKIVLQNWYIQYCHIFFYCIRSTCQHCNYFWGMLIIANSTVDIICTLKRCIRPWSQLDLQTGAFCASSGHVWGWVSYREWRRRGDVEKATNFAITESNLLLYTSLL